MRFLHQTSVARATLCTVICGSMCSVVLAQKAPELGYVFPPVVRAGESREVVLGGYDLTPDIAVHSLNEHVDFKLTGDLGECIVPPPPYWFGEKGRLPAFPLPREIPASVDVPADVSAGPVRWQVSNANGSSAAAILMISDDREINEQRYRDNPQQIGMLPVGISGRLSRITEVDRYRIVPTRDGPISIDLFARRLGSDFHGVLRVRDESGRVIADVVDTRGTDVAVTFIARAMHKYDIELHDVDYRGNRAFVYRLHVNDGPRVITTQPAVLPRGKKCELTFVGVGIATGEARLETTTRFVTAPEDSDSTSLTYQLETPFGRATPIEIAVSDLDEIVFEEVSAGDQAPSSDVEPPLVIAPTALTGRFAELTSQSVKLKATKGEHWTIAAESRAIGTDLDLSITVKDESGKQLAFVDDAAGTTDAVVELVVPADGEYLCTVENLSGEADALASVFRLSFNRREQDFALSVPQQLNVPVGGKTQLTVTAQRYGGFDGEIPITVAGLPDGVSVGEPLTIPAGKTSLKISVESDAMAACKADWVEISAETSVDGKRVVKTARATAGGNLAVRSDRQARTDRVLLTTTLSPKFSVELVDKNRQRAVHRGTTYPAPFILNRDDGFEGEIILQMAARQGRHRQGIVAPTKTVAADQQQALYPCFMPEWLETDRTTRMVVLGMALQADGAGQRHYVTRPADARVTMILEGALLKVAHGADELTVAAGNSFEVPVTVARSAKLDSEVELQLVAPPELQGLVSLESESVRLAPAVGETSLRVNTVMSSTLRGVWELKIQARAIQDDRWPVLSETTVPVEFVVPETRSEPESAAPR